MTSTRLSPFRHPRRQRGVGLVTAIFLLVVLAGLSVAMVSIFNAQQTGSNQDLQGARAYQAARAGLEWGLFQQMRNGRCDADKRFAMPADSTLAGFHVVVTCVPAGAVPADGSPNLARFVITATACSMADAQGACTARPDTDYVMRQLEAEI
jgi:MSHA biogenesis protein MshP